jgi:hypothetical protein
MRWDGHSRAVSRIALAIALVAASAAMLPAPAAQAQAQATFQVATARVEITPNAIGFPDYYRSGYASNAPVHVTGGLPLYATGLLMVNSAGQRYVVVSTDTIGLPMSVTDHLQAEAQSRFGISPQQLLLGATHTHSGPVLIDQPNTYITYGIAPTTSEDQLVRAYTSALEARIIELIGTLLAGPTVPVTATFATGVANGAENRSAQRPTVTEPSVPVLTLRNSADQRIVAVVFGYASHAVTAGEITSWHPDFPGVAVNLVESQLSAANPGVRALYLRGASGDLNPADGFTPQSLGQLVATEVVAAATGGPGTGGAPVLEPESAAYQDVQAPLDIRVSDATLRAHYAAVLANPPTGPDARHAQVILNELDTGSLRRAMRVQVTAWRFGGPSGGKPLGMLAMGGEALADYAVGMQNVLGRNYRVWTVTQTNGHPGYLPPDEVLARSDGCQGGPTCFYGGYESGWDVVEGQQRYPLQSSTTYNDGVVAPLAPGTDNLLCRSASALLTGAAADCTAFTPGRVIPHSALASTGPALAGWTDSSGRPRLELLALGTDRCLYHRSWTGDANGALTGVWSAWDAPICGGIVGPSAAEVWVDASGRARIELVVRTGDGSLFHGSCVGNSSGCANVPWQWTQIATPSDGVAEQPELSVWQQAGGQLRIDVYAVRGSGRCLYHRGFVGNSDQVSGSWTSWTANPGCGGIIGPAAAASWRSGQTLNHDVMVRTSSNALYARRCVGTESSCAYQPWVALAAPPAGAAGSPTYTTAPAAGGRRFDLYVRGGDSCIWHAAWTTTAIPASPSWRQIDGCGLASRVGAVDWRDSHGRSRSTIVALDQGANGPVWVRQTTSRSGQVANDVRGPWEDIADPSGRISNP